MQGGPLVNFLFLVIVAFSTTQAARKTYKDYKLIQINPKSPEHINYLRKLWLSGSPFELDFWQPPTHSGGSVDIAVAPANADVFFDDLSARGLTYNVAINDLEQAILNEKKGSNIAEGEQSEPRAFQFNAFNRFDQIQSYLKKLETDNPDRVTLINIGQSHENRPLTVIKLSGKKTSAQKPAIWIDGGIHAREWISPATVLYFIKQLNELYVTDSHIQTLLDQLDWYILPVMNPDGYEYSHTQDRMWRKNRRPGKCVDYFGQTICCDGVDLNRNFDWYWATTGSSSNPCMETYHGSSAFSEPESAAVRDFIAKLGAPVKGFVSLHAYSQMWLLPYGHEKGAYPSDYESALRPLALRATNALKALYGTEYILGTGADILYDAAGTSADWAKGKANVPYANIIELRPQNLASGIGFILSEDQIQPTGTETWEAIKVVADEIIEKFGQAAL